MSPEQIVFGEARLEADQDNLAYTHSVVDLGFRVAALFEAFAPVIRQGANSATHRVKDLHDGQQFYVASGLTVATDVREALEEDPYAPNDYDFAILNFAMGKEPLQLPGEAKAHQYETRESLLFRGNSDAYVHRTISRRQYGLRVASRTMIRLAAEKSASHSDVSAAAKTLNAALARLVEVA